ncbi:MAG TPA: hypothetical protein VLF62_05210 [Candidatus Saccharimonadales bacterium]|nr:hypothetical protein [Candidatus Saccharimonadales bacterium]
MSEFATSEISGNTSLGDSQTVPPGLENAYSFADISPPEADAINDKVNVVVYGTIHELSDPANTDPAYLAAVDAQYQGLADMVDVLDPAKGDVMYMESVGHEGVWKLLDRPQDDAAHARILESKRADRTIHPYIYAAERAALRGVPVKVADMHRHVGEEFGFVTGESIDTVKSNTDHPLFPILNTLREEQAANTVAHDALNALPAIGPEKAMYVVLHGAAHVDKVNYDKNKLTPGTPAAFQRLGIHVMTGIIDSHIDVTPQSEQMRGNNAAVYIAPIARW